MEDMYFDSKGEVDRKAFVEENRRRLERSTSSRVHPLHRSNDSIEDIDMARRNSTDLVLPISETNPLRRSRSKRDIDPFPSRASLGSSSTNVGFSPGVRKSSNGGRPGIPARRNSPLDEMVNSPAQQRDFNRINVRGLVEVDHNSPACQGLESHAWLSSTERDSVVFEKAKSLRTRTRDRLKRVSTAAVKLKDRAKWPGSKMQSSPKSKSTGVLKVSASEEVQMRKYEKDSKRLIDPRSSFMRWWGCTMVGMMAFTAFATPYEVIFVTHDGFNTIFWINRAVDFVFLCDISVNLHLLYTVDAVTGKRVMSRREIVHNYLKDWLIWEIVALIPFDSIHVALDIETATVWRLLRMVRLFRLGELSNSMRSVMSFVENKLPINYAVVQICQGCLWTSLYCHWVACVWMLLPKMAPAQDYTWLRAYLDSDIPRKSDAFSMYCVSLYWSILTLGTTGYGDIVPLTNGERIYSCIIMMFGAYYFGYVVGNITAIVAAQNLRVTEFYNTMDELNSFMAQQTLPRILQSRLREFFRSRQQGAAFNYSTLVSKMSPSLRAEVMFYTAALQISHHRIFKRCSPDFTATLAMHMQPEFFAPREKLISPKDYPTKMHFIRRGVVGCQGRVYTIGGYIGKDMLFDLFLDLMNGMRRSYSAVALTYVESLCLNQSALPTILQEYPFATGTMRVQVFREVLRMEVLAYTNAYRRICNHESSGHVMLRGDPLDREAFHYEKLLLVFDSDEDEMELMENSAIVLQRHFRNFIARRDEELKTLGSVTIARRRTLSRVDSRNSRASSLQPKKGFNSRLDKMPTFRSGLEAVMNVLKGSTDTTNAVEAAQNERERKSNLKFSGEAPAPVPFFPVSKGKSPVHLTSMPTNRKFSNIPENTKKRFSIGHWEEGFMKKIPVKSRSRGGLSMGLKPSRHPSVYERESTRTAERSTRRSSNEFNECSNEPFKLSRNNTQEMKARDWDTSDPYSSNIPQMDEKIGKIVESHIEANVGKIMETAMTAWISANMPKMLEEHMIPVARKMSTHFENVNFEGNASPYKCHENVAECPVKRMSMSSMDGIIESMEIVDQDKSRIE